MSRLVGVTIGIGEQFRFYAEKAAEEVRKMCGIEVRIIGDEHLHLAHEIDSGNIDDLKHRVWTLKYRIFDIWPDLDAVMYFDCDWRPVRSFDATAHFLTIAKHYDFAICKDRTNEHCEGLKKQYGLPHDYMNAGFFVSNKQGMANVATQFFANYNKLPKTWGDQCVLNQILDNFKWSPLPKKYNVQDLYDQAHNSEVIGYHSSTNYHFYEGMIVDFDWSRSVQDELSSIEGLNHEWATAMQHLIELHYTAKSYKYGNALEIGTFKGHGAAALARACMKVDTVDVNTNHAFANRQAITDKGRWPVNFLSANGMDYLRSCAEQGQTYDLIFHDSYHGNRVIPELKFAFDKVLKPNGVMVVHDVDMLNLADLLELLNCKHHTVSNDYKGRQLGVFHKRG
jgi:lipopolysaccharide biosynthesis glycosyltransferase